MDIGCCCNMIATRKDGIGFEWVRELTKIGYDYIELPLAQIMALSEDEFQELREQMGSYGIRCRACNNFFPVSVRLTGRDVNDSVISDYVAAAVRRASGLGAESIVFGSSGAKNVPDGFSVERAWEQLVHLLRLIDSIVASAGIVVAIEPLNRRESNIVNTVAEGLKLAQETDREHIRLLVDYYHLIAEDGDIASVTRAAGYLSHLHIANPAGRHFPSENDKADYSEFLKCVHDAGYAGKISVEAYSTDVVHDASGALEYLKHSI
jgi:Sugar phosphate isomerases/epimerases